MTLKRGQPNARLSRAEAALRDHALAYPDSYEEFPWDHRAIKVKGKIFVIMSVVEGTLNVSLKLPLSSKIALGLPFATPTEYGLGKSGWVTARFAAKDKVPIEMLEEWIDESYRAIAPRRLVATLDGSGSAADSQAMKQSKKMKRAKR